MKRTQIKSWVCQYFNMRVQKGATFLQNNSRMRKSSKKKHRENGPSDVTGLVPDLTGREKAPGVEKRAGRENLIKFQHGGEKKGPRVAGLGRGGNCDRKETRRGGQSEKSSGQPESGVWVSSPKT